MHRNEKVPALGKDRPGISRHNTLGGTRIYLADHMEEGTDCPCCGQMVKVYARGISAASARSLIALSQWPGEFVHVDQIAEGGGDKKRSGDFAKLRWWGLIEQQENEDPAKRTSGYWRITPFGLGFVSGHNTVAAKALLYNNQLLGWTDERITIQQALGKKFNYEELMAARG